MLFHQTYMGVCGKLALIMTVLLHLEAKAMAMMYFHCCNGFFFSWKKQEGKQRGRCRVQSGESLPGL